MASKRVSIKKDCPIGRYKAGEVGSLLENDSTKYDHKVELTPVKNTNKDDSGFLSGVDTIYRVLYFYSDEINII